jgi:hypothetical protein
MDRRLFLARCGGRLAGLATLVVTGCRGHQTAHVVSQSKSDMVGSHAAGAESFKPLVEEAVGQLLGRQHEFQTVSASELPPPPKKICFVGVENKSAEEIGDFKDQIYQVIDSKILESRMFQPISARFVQAALAETRLRPDQLFIPQNMGLFAGVLEQQGQPFDYLLYATITSGTTTNNKDYQRDYLLTLELTNVRTGHYDKQSASLRKGYHKSFIGKIRNYGLGS